MLIAIGSPNNDGKRKEKLERLTGLKDPDNRLYLWCSLKATLSEDRAPTKGKEEDTTFW
jgi:hypothetical protein